VNFSLRFWVEVPKPINFLEADFGTTAGSHIYGYGVIGPDERKAYVNTVDFSGVINQNSVFGQLPSRLHTS
jgi:hypothetical protein